MAATTAAFQTERGRQLTGDRRVLLSAFAVSGFSALIYESLWTHYLKLFLGHAAYAQTLVLAIFMGGLAIGSWICSRHTERWGSLLRGYALAEGVIGAAALTFHPAFMTSTGFTYSTLVPALQSETAVTLVKWTLGALLILPQSILLGMTFPLMAGGFLRAFPDRPGASLAALYFCNSIGAAAGVLVSGFYLVPNMGLPGTGVVAGLLNLALAAVVWRTASKLSQPLPGGAADVAPAAAAASSPYGLMLSASLFTGAASFMYEIGWIRMLSLVLGSSTQAFELMLSAFILGLALGGIWIRRRLDRLENPVAFLAGVQVAMGILAVSTLPVYGWTLPLMRWLVETLPKTDAGYLQFNLASHAIAMSVMLPAAFCAGTTLPLITHALVRSRRGESSIGAVYGANTVGAIGGIAAAVHVGLPMLGLKLLVVAGAAIDIAVGLALFLSIGAVHRRIPAMATAAGVAALAVAAFGVQLDARLMATGVFRSGQQILTAESSLLFHRDGKTATVHVVERDGAIDIRTNGKVDASVRMVTELPPTSDEPTQVISGALPLLLHPEARSAAVVGLGSGMTTHVLLGAPSLQRVDSIEIEPAMIEGAEAFRPRNERAYSDPRSRIVVDDAKTFFATRQQSYDIIVSEPSNPWVSGTASLFSVEFYRLVREHLNANGVLVQWLQLYEFDLDLVASVLKAVGDQFDDYVIYQPVGSDVLIVAANGGPVPELTAAPFAHDRFAADLRRVGVRSLQDVLVRRIGDRRLLEPWLRTLAIAANSDFHPVLYHRAARARFLNRDAGPLSITARGPLPVLELLGGIPVPWQRTDVTPEEVFSPARDTAIAMVVRDLLLGQLDAPGSRETDNRDSSSEVEARRLVDRCRAGGDERGLYDLGLYVARLRPAEAAAVWSSIEAMPCGSRLTPAEREWMVLFRAVGARDARTIAAVAERLLATESGAPERRGYLVAAGMLGHLAAGAPDAARALGEKYPAVEGRQWAFLVSLLSAHAGERSATVVNR